MHMNYQNFKMEWSLELLSLLELFPNVPRNKISNIKYSKIIHKMLSNHILMYFLFVTVISSILLTSSANGELSLTTDRSIYVPRENIFIEGFVDRVIPDYNEVMITIISPEDKILLNDVVELYQGTGFYYKIDLMENTWDTDGLHKVQVKYEHQISTIPFYYFKSTEPTLRHIASHITLDRDVYSWIDTVKIIVIAPSFNIDKDKIEMLGSKKNNELETPDSLKIQGIEIPEFYKDQIIRINTSSGGEIEDYHLVETSENSGIFHGKIHLTGDCRFDINGDGKKCDVPGITEIRQEPITPDNPYGKPPGPVNGYISASDGVTLEIEFENEAETVIQTADVFWNKGRILLDEPFLIPNNSVEVYVEDSDLNINPKNQDNVSILLERISDRTSQNINSYNTWDRTTKELDLLETDINTGIFKREIIIVTNQSEDTKSRIYALDGENLQIKYFDYTIPRDSKDTNPEIKILVPVCELEISCNISSTIQNTDLGFKENTLIEQVSLDIMIPSWIKVNAGWWADGTLDDDSFIQGIQFMIKEGIIQIPVTAQVFNSETDGIPSWIKVNAGWWADGTLDDDSFIQGIQFMIKEGIMRITN